MTAPAVWLPCALGCAFFIAGICTYWRDLSAQNSRSASGLLALGPVFIAAALAAFAGEHFTAATTLSRMVPRFMPARLFIAYFVGVAHLAAALSLVARRCVRWSTFFLGIMFALFVLLLHLPGAIHNPTVRIAWIVSVRETTFSLGAFALFSTQVRDLWPLASRRLPMLARFWSAMVIIYFGLDQILHPAYTPGVPDTKPTPAWVPLPHLLVYVVGMLLIAFGITMFFRKYAVSGAKYAGELMLFLTLVLFVPEFFLARDVAQHVIGYNFVFDTLLFAGTMLVIARAVLASESLSKEVASAPSPAVSGVSGPR